MPRTCTVCTHEKRLEVERALVRREPYRNIAERFSLSTAALSRHAKEHLPDRIKKVSEEEEFREALDIAEQLKAINDASLAVLKEARERKRPETALKAIDRIYRQIGLQLKITEHQEFEERLAALEASALSQRSERR
jgi:excinuclease UvrABC nuclease subunit